MKELKEFAKQVSIVLCVFILSVLMCAGIAALIDNAKLRVKLDAINAICENNAHENPISWTIMDIIDGEEQK